jgi:hypothetical protein
VRVVTNDPAEIAARLRRRNDTPLDLEAAEAIEDLLLELELFRAEENGMAE